MRGQAITEADVLQRVGMKAQRRGQVMFDGSGQEQTIGAGLEAR